MNRLLYVLAAFVVINLIFSVIPFIMPRAPPELITPYMLWVNALVLLFLVLPSMVGNFSSIQSSEN